MNRLTMLAINDEGFVFDPCSGESYIVNSTGLSILKALKGNLKDEDILAVLCNEFDVITEDALADIADFKNSLEKLGFKVG